MKTNPSNHNQVKNISLDSPNATPPATRRELFAWCMYDFANSGFATVILTAIFNAYFVGVVAASMDDSNSGSATLLWTIAIAIANGLVVFSAPVLGAIADDSANKKRFLIITTIGCIIATALLSSVGPGEIALAMTLVILATVMFSSGENLIAAFLPEICPPEKMGRLSGYGWAVGYIGALITLGLCLAYITWAEGQGHSAAQFVPMTCLIVAVIFLLTSLPTIFWLRERATPQEQLPALDYVRAGFKRLGNTLSHARMHTDMFRFLGVITVYYSGIHTVIVLAAIYAQEVMGFTTRDTLLLIMVVNVTAAIGALLFGWLQDHFGSKRCLAWALACWALAILIAYHAHDEAMFWLAANLIGIALGGAQSGGRALVGQFSPPERSGEYFGLWGLATKLAAITGPLSYGAVTYFSGGDQRLALASTLVFFISGIILLFFVNEKRGREMAQVKY